jgi:D-alanyl-D-alanine carboxypeptidase
VDGLPAVETRISEIRAKLSLVGPAPLPEVFAPSGVIPDLGTFPTKYAEAVFETNGTKALAAGAAGRLNADGIPADLAPYGNGKVPMNALAPVGSTGHRLWAPAATALDRLLTAARRDGVQIGISDSYRPYPEQVDIANRKGLYRNGGLAAVPGTSDHGWGKAVDLDLGDRAQGWMAANANRFGFEADTPREPWHWSYTPA